MITVNQSNDIKKLIKEVEHLAMEKQEYLDDKHYESDQDKNNELRQAYHKLQKVRENIENLKTLLNETLKNKDADYSLTRKQVADECILQKNGLSKIILID